MKKIIGAVLLSLALSLMTAEVGAESYIKWVDMTVTAGTLRDACEYDVSSYGSVEHVKTSELLACLAVKYGGEFGKYRKNELDKIIERLKNGESIAEIAGNEKLFGYYTEAYSAIFDGMICEYDEYRETDGKTVCERKYGVCAFSPFAEGYYYSDYDDFGAARSYGYRRPHLGHDMMGSVGTPIVACEAGYVEACGWNMYGGWRIGIRSFDGKRYYYYAHLRKGHPYADIYEGKIVAAGEVIGYLGMTGYSSREDTNNIDTPHLHFGLQLIFDKSQKDGNNQIWLDMYELTRFLSKYREPVVRDGDEYRALVQKIPVNMWD